MTKSSNEDPTTLVPLSHGPKQPLAPEPWVAGSSPATGTLYEYALRTRLEFAAAVGVVEALGVFFGGFLPGVAAAAQRAGEVGRPLFVEGAAALLAVGRHLDQQVVDQ